MASPQCDSSYDLYNITILCGSHTTLPALRRSIPSVTPYMIYYIIVCDNSFAALAAFMWLLPGVTCHMIHKPTFLRETFVTYIACIGMISLQYYYLYESLDCC
ncbi:unnamed protein product [Meganyctiphanes norvegica]|uniref:Uncharacterized protein n=1 Tax=Meganyctiphanes norvegica TaxID=48144 RepID=A0AAV2S5K3_MEGNR